MNCHEAQRHLFAAGDIALDSSQRASLDQHVAQCASCRRIRDDLGAALMAWRSEAVSTPIPAPEREWLAVRRRIRGGSEAGGSIRSAHPRRRLFPWIAVPLGTAAAFALALLLGPSGSDDSRSSVSAAHVARADSVEVPGNASTMVFVDDRSGWLIVWASDGSNQI